MTQANMRQAGMLFYGASGHGKVVIDCWLEGDGIVVGIFDDDPTRRQVLNLPVIGAYQSNFQPELPLVITIGSNQIRKKIASIIRHRFGNVFHPAATISKTTKIGSGIVVMAGAVINSDVELGDHAIINTGSIIDHDCSVGNFTHIAPGSTLCGGVHIGEGSLVGAGATIIPGIKVGSWVTIGAGAVVTRDIPDHALIVGVPGQERRKMMNG